MFSGHKENPMKALKIMPVHETKTKIFYTRAMHMDVGVRGEPLTSKSTEPRPLWSLQVTKQE